MRIKHLRFAHLTISFIHTGGVQQHQRHRRIHPGPDLRRRTRVLRQKDAGEDARHHRQPRFRHREAAPRANDAPRGLRRGPLFLRGRRGGVPEDRQTEE